MVPVITIPASRAGGAAAFAVAAPHDRGYHPYKEEEDGRSEGSLGEGALPPCSTPLGVSFQPCLRLGSESSLFSRAGGAAAFAVAAAPHDRGYHPYKEEEALPPCSTPGTAYTQAPVLPTRRHRRCYTQAPGCLHAGTGAVSFQPFLRLGSESSLGCLLNNEMLVRCALNNEKLSK